MHMVLPHPSLAGSPSVDAVGWKIGQRLVNLGSESQPANPARRVILTSLVGPVQDPSQDLLFLKLHILTSDLALCDQKLDSPQIEN
jgi:hypothetical protein